VIFKLDLNDAVGPRRGSVRLGRWGAQAMSVDGSNIPERLAEAGECNAAGGYPLVSA